MDRLHRSPLLIPCSSRTVRGYTLTELVTAMVIVGIVAAIAAPRFFERNAFESRGFHNQVVSSLRYAQKAAVAQQRFVCVTFTLNSITLAMGATAACGTNLAGPTGQSPYSVSSNSASFAAIPLPFHFDASGRPSVAQSIALNGYAASIKVEAETGHVH